jgi:hypothetical protein
MKVKYSFVIVAVILAFILGCSGTLGKFKTKTGEDRVATIQEIKDNLDEYNVYHCPLVSVLDPKADDKTVEMTGKSCSTVDPQEAATFSEEYSVKDFPVKGLKEISGPEDQFYGYVIIWNDRRASAGAMLTEDKTMRVYPHYVPYGGP